MSSHHIVRENQEPALLLVNISGTPPSVIQDLLEWSPLVMVCEQSLEEVLKWHIKIDVAIVREKMRSRWLSALQHQAPVKVFSYADNELPWLTAFYLLKSIRQRSVHIVGLHPVQINYVPDDLEITTFEQNMRWTYVRWGQFEKWFPSGVRIEVLGDNAAIAGVNTDGRTAAEGLVRITASSPYWLGELIEATSV